MYLFGLPNAALWGALAAVANFVPYAGAAAMALVVGAVGVLSFDQPLQMLAGTPLASRFHDMGFDRSGARIGSDDDGLSVVEAAGRVQEAGERLLVKRLDLLRLEMAELARAGGLGLVGAYVAAVGLLLLAGGAVVWLDGFWTLESALLAVGGGAVLLGLLVLAGAVRRASREKTE